MPINASDQQFFELLSELLNHPDENPPELNIDLVRKKIKRLKSFIGEPADLPHHDLSFQSEHGHNIPMRHYGHDSDSNTPLIIYFPGNAYVHELIEENHCIISKIAKAARCQAIMVTPRRAPEHPYPEPLEDALESIRYIHKNAERFNANPERIILAGYSNGAAFAAIASNTLRNNRNIHVFHQCLISGGFDLTHSSKEFAHYAAQDKLLDPVRTQFCMDCYADSTQTHLPNCSPFWEPDLSNNPNTTLIMGEYDLVRSHGEAYAKRLIEAGNQVNKLVLKGQTHSTILCRKVCTDGEDPAIVAGRCIRLAINAARG